LKRKYDESLSNVAFDFNVLRRPYIKVKKNEIVDVEMEMNAFKKQGAFTFVGTGTGSVVKANLNMEAGQ
jgi:hypothetical protein